jgi:hypothetical protein
MWGWRFCFKNRPKFYNFRYSHLLEGNFVCLDYQSLKDYFSKTTKWKLNILVSMCFWKIALYCKLNFIFQNQFNQKLCNIMRKKLRYALWLKIACPGQITHHKFVFPLLDLTGSNYSLQNCVSGFWYMVSFIHTVKVNPSILFPISKRHKYF